MRSEQTLVSLILGAMALLTASRAAADPVEGGYRVHEWGVFVDGRAATHNPALPTLSPPQITVDKPILYFYGATPQALRAEVTFAQGGPREAWPPVPLAQTLRWDVTLAPGACDRTPYPAPGASCEQVAASGGGDVAPGEGQLGDRLPVDGDGEPVDVLPTGADRPVDLPPAPWCESSELSRYEVPGAMCVSHGGRRAPLLFYAGSVPAPALEALEVRVGAEGNCWMSVTVTNRSAAPVHDVFALVYEPTQAVADGTTPASGARHVEVVALDRLGPGEAHGWCAGHAPGAGPQAQLEGARRAFHARLERRGLTPDESRALGVAWDETFFGLTPPARRVARGGGGDRSVSVLYTLDAASYDAILPLRLEPAPSERVRVGVVYEPDALATP